MGNGAAVMMDGSTDSMRRRIRFQGGFHAGGRESGTRRQEKELFPESKETDTETRQAERTDETSEEEPLQLALTRISRLWALWRRRRVYRL